MKLERIEQEIAKAKAKIAELQGKVKDLETQRTEQENLELVQLIRTLNMTPQELVEFVKSTVRGEKGGNADEE